MAYNDSSPVAARRSSDRTQCPFSLASRTAASSGGGDGGIGGGGLGAADEGGARRQERAAAPACSSSESSLAAGEAMEEAITCSAAIAVLRCARSTDGEGQDGGCLEAEQAELDRGAAAGDGWLSRVEATRAWFP